jgi:Gene product 79
MRQVAIALGAILVFVGGWFAGERSVDLFDQDTFPCAEDEVLGFSPAFGPDRVGCIHIDSLVG